MLIKRPATKPPRLLIYGKPGIGKTTFGAGMPEALLIPCEDGSANANCDQTEAPTSWVGLLATLSECASQTHKTIVVDSVTRAQELLFRHICQLERAKTIEAACGGYGKGYIVATEMFRELLNVCDNLRDAGKIVCLLAHEAVAKYEDPRMEAYDRLSPRIYVSKKGEGIAPMAIEWADVVGCAAYEVFVKDGKGIGTSERILYLEERPAYLAKNRYNLPESIPFTRDSAQQLMAAIRAAMKQTQQPKQSAQE